MTELRSENLRNDGKCSTFIRFHILYFRISVIVTDFWRSKVSTGHGIFMSTYKYLQFIMIKIGSFVTAKRFRKFLIPETSILESIHVKVKPQNRSFTFLENLDFEFFHVLELILEKLSDLLLLSIERHLFMLRRRLRKRLNWRYDHLWRVIYRGTRNNPLEIRLISPLQK